MKKLNKTMLKKYISAMKKEKKKGWNGFLFVHSVFCGTKTCFFGGECYIMGKAEGAGIFCF